MYVKYRSKQNSDQHMISYVSYTNHESDWKIFCDLNIQSYISYMNHELDQIKFQVYAYIYIWHEHELETVLDQNSDLCMLSYINYMF